MLFAFGKIILSGIVISFVSWLSGRKTGLAGFLTALPLGTLLALAFSQVEFKNSSQTVEYAKSILYAIPLSLLFFIPFLLSKKLNLGFWTCYGAGIILLFIGFLVHSWIVKS